MTIPATVQRYLDDQHIPYDVLAHPHTATSIRTASAAHIPVHQLAKAVVLENDSAYLMAVLPADRRLRIGHLSQWIGRHVGLATERELATLFADCAPGAVPPLGAAYGMETVLDDELTDAPDVYFEAGDHEALIRMKTDRFMQLMHDARHGHFV